MVESCVIHLVRRQVDVPRHDDFAVIDRAGDG